MFNHSPRIVTNGLVLCLDAANPKSYGGSGTVWKDLSGNGNNGTLTNGPTFDSGSIVFDSTNERVTTGINSFGNNTTWGAWVNRTSSINGFNMFMGRFLPYFGIRDSNVVIFSNVIGGVQSTVVSSPLSVPNSRWYQLYFTTEYTGTSTISKIYINGVLSATGTFSGAQGPSSAFFTIGDGQVPAWYPFNGRVSNVQIYNRTLSVQEILQNYNATKNRFGL